MDQTDQP